MTPAIVVSICALAFTVTSYWWLHWRTGKLIIAPPRSYMALSNRGDKTIVYFPLVLF